MGRIILDAFDALQRWGKQLRSELVETSEVETFWRSNLKVFRNRVLAIPHRVEYLLAR